MSEPVPMAQMVTLTIDGVEVSVPKGTQAIRAAEAAGIPIPRFCDHPLLEPLGACRQCMVEIVDLGNGRGFPKPQPACATEAAQGMILKSQATSESAKQAQADILELLLINHPLDCPICDKAGECPLQNQAMANGRGESRYDGVKREYPKPVAMSELILLDRERCVLCSRCTRFADQIAGDPLVALVERGAKQQVGIYPEEPYRSYFSGNVVQICPVGALTSADYRFSARPFDLVSTVTTCENCAAGCQLRVDSRHGQIRRRYAGDNPQVNEEWSCDKGRFGFDSSRGDRVTRPMIRRKGKLVEVSWPEALAVAASGLRTAGSSSGVLTGGRLTLEVATTYSRFARAVLGTNSIDYRTRASGAEEAQFLGQFVAGTGQIDDEGTTANSVTYDDLATAGKVILVCFDPEDESPNVFLRLRKAYRKQKLPIETVAAYLSPGSRKMGATLIPTRPNDIVAAIAALEADAETIILAGERLAEFPGTFTALAEKIATSGARLAWIPRRAGAIGAIEAGLLPNLLPGGRLVEDKAARRQIGELWGVKLPKAPGLDVTQMLAAAASGELKALVTAGIDAEDFPDPDAALEAFGPAFVVSLEQRMSKVAEHADVVLPVDLLEHTEGTFLNWERRLCPVRQVTSNPRTPMTELRVLAALAEAMGIDLGIRTVAGAQDALAEIPAWEGRRAVMTPVTPEPETEPPAGVVVSAWRELLDDSRCIDAADGLREGAREPKAYISPQTQRIEGLATSTHIRLTGPGGSATFPLVVDAGMAEGVIWVPAHAPGQALSRIGVRVGSPVTLAAAPDPKKVGEE